MLYGIMNAIKTTQPKTDREIKFFNSLTKELDKIKDNHPKLYMSARAHYIQDYIDEQN